MTTGNEIREVRSSGFQYAPDYKCNLGMECDRVGVCFALAHGRPELCGVAELPEHNKSSDTSWDNWKLNEDRQHEKDAVP